jgi:hypothetical protein
VSPFVRTYPQPFTAFLDAWYGPWPEWVGPANCHATARQLAGMVTLVDVTVPSPALRRPRTVGWLARWSG